MADDPRRTAGNILTLSGMALVILLFGSILLTGATSGGSAIAPDPSRATCEARAADLPATVPPVLVLNVTDEDGERLAPDERARVAATLEAAIARFDLPLPIALQLDDTRVARPVGAHVAELQVWSGRALLPEGDDGNAQRAMGMMCGNTIIVRLQGDPAFDAWTATHELGHLLGLPHHDGTLMNDDANRAPRFDALADCQRAVLDGWRAGAPYVPHWLREECREQDPAWLATLDAWRYGLTRT